MGLERAADGNAAKRQELAEKIRAVFWQPLRIADHDAANAALDLLLAELDRAEDRAWEERSRVR